MDFTEINARMVREWKFTPSELLNFYKNRSVKIQQVFIQHLPAEKIQPNVS